MTRRRVWIVLLCLGGVGLLAGTVAVSANIRSQPGLAAASTPAEGVVCSGFVDGEFGVTSLSSTAAGRVAEVCVREGEEVTAGAVLLRLDDAATRLRLTEAEAVLATAEAQLTEARKLPEQQQARLVQQQSALTAARHRLEAAQAALTHKRDLLSARLIHPSEVAVVEGQVKELEALVSAEEGRLAELRLRDPGEDVRRAEAEAAAVRARRDQARLALDECSLKAPQGGTVLRVFATVGELLPSATRQAAVQFLPKGRLVVRAEVDQEFAAAVAADRPAVVRDDADASRAWTGRVLRLSDWYAQRRSVSPEPFQRVDVRTLECLIEIDPGQAPLRIGQRMQVTIQRTSANGK